MSRTIKIAMTVFVAAACVAVVSLATVAPATDRPMTVTAQFEDTVGLYEGNTVNVLGMRVGRVSRIAPKDTYVEVTMEIDNGIDVPADAHAVTINTSLLTDRSIELTPVYHGGPKMENGDVVGLGRTRTPVEIDRTLAMIDKLSGALAGDGTGQGPLADLIAVSEAATSGNGDTIKTTLDQLSEALRLGADNGANTKENIQAVVANLAELTQAAADNDTTIRDFGSNLRQLTDILADEQLGTGSTGAHLNQVLAMSAELLEKNRDMLKGTVGDANTLTTAMVDFRRELAETFDLAPLVADNVYNIIDQNAGSIRGKGLIDKVLLDGQMAKEICNLANQTHLGCATGTTRDFGPDFGLSAMFELMAGNFR